MESEIEVRSDPQLRTEEKETIIAFAKGESRVHIHSDHVAVVRWLLRHPDYEERESRGDGDVKYSTTGTIPIGALKLSGRRESEHISGILGQIPEEDE